MSVRHSYQRRPRQIRLFLLITGVLGFLFMMSFGREYVGNLQIQREIARLEAERDSLQSTQAQQLLELQKLSSTYYLEKEAREKHGLSAPGEQVYIVKDDPFSVRSAVKVDPSAKPAPVPIWKQWVQYFFMNKKEATADYESGA